MIKLPITNQPNQSFTTTIPLGQNNITLDFYVFWNRIANYWQMNITNTSTGVRIISGLPLLCIAPPYHNLLRQFAYLGIGAAYITPIAKSPNDSPGEADWDSVFILLWDSQ